MKVPGYGRLKRHIRRYRYLAKNDFSPIFVCGVGGSGNTLISALIDQQFETSGFADESALYAPSSNLFSSPSTTTFKNIFDYYNALRITEPYDSGRLHKDLCEIYRQYVEEPRNQVLIDKAPNSSMVRVEALSKAFPEAFFILVWRDPLVHIEGLVRKWPLFGNSDIHEVIEFWKLIHEEFVSSIKSSQVKAGAICFEDFLEDPEIFMKDIGTFCSLTPRKKIKTRKKIENKKGFALRNVTGGKIKIDKLASNIEASQYSDFVRKELEGTVDSLKNQVQTISAAAVLNNDK